MTRRLPIVAEKPLPSASKLGLAFACPAPWSQGYPRADETSKAAEYGTRVHEVAARMAMRVRAEEPCLSDNSPPWMHYLRDQIGRDEWAMSDDNPFWLIEEGFWWMPGFVDHAECIDRAPGEELSGAFSGTVDLAYMRQDGVLIVADWKTGWQQAALSDAESHHQLWALALFFARSEGIELAEGDPSRIVARVELRHVSDKGIRVDGADLSAEDLLGYARELERLAADIQAGAPPRPGGHCELLRCPCRSSCPAYRELAEGAALVAAEPVQELGAEVLRRPPRTADEAQQLLLFVRALREHLPSWEEWIKGYVLTHEEGIKEAPGVSIVAAPRAKPSLVKTPEALEVIAEVLGPDGAAMAIVERVVKSTTLTDIRKAAGAGIKDKAERAKAVETVEAELAARGVMRQAGKAWALVRRKSGGRDEMIARLEEGGDDE